MEAPRPQNAESAFNLHPDLVEVLESAARLQRLVSGAVLVGGAAAAWYAGHRASYDHDHVLADLRDRFDMVLEALEADPGFHLARTTPLKIILGDLGGIEMGVRQMIRTRPLETQEAILPSGASVVVATLAETIRVKGFLAVRRNQTRDYLDVAALSARFGIDAVGKTLNGIDAYYTDDTKPVSDQPVRSQLLTQLAQPHPADPLVTERLDTYKGIRPPWTNWQNVVGQCARLAGAMEKVG